MFSSAMGSEENVGVLSYVCSPKPPVKSAAHCLQDIHVTIDVTIFYSCYC